MIQAGSAFCVWAIEFFAIIVFPRLFLAFLTLDLFLSRLIYLFVLIWTLFLGRHVHLALSKTLIF
ncbi:hypothetical protein BK671_16450 [Pseudomonas fluorescens]|uniref:Uncharacterized protein n=1 Tax=Pseudomonas fluorescens TaxID=294 RepID=A0A423LCR4_PSEFL|nr:hypothetical protein BK671_16450 [Pseudomonas fluorescens]